MLKADYKFNSLKDLKSYFLANSSEKTFLIETSGTTSIQKKVKVSLKKCIRQVKIYDDKSSRVWGNCYPVKSFACTQVFFQAFFNCETIVYCFTNDFKKVNHILINEKVTNLTCTPTFLNMLIISSDVKNENSNGDYFPKNDNILGKRTSNQVDLCDLSPTTRNENEIASDKKRDSQDLDDICSENSSDSEDDRSRKHRL